MKIIIGAEEGRRTLLRRQPLGETALPDAVWQRTREAVGDVSTVEEAVRKILQDVRKDGDAAVLRYCQAFDGAAYSTLRVGQDEVRAAYDQVDPEVVAALRFAADRIRAFHEEQRQHVLQSFSRDGIGVQVTALGRVGINAPGTAVVYPSSVLMTAIPAKTAGVEDVLIASPAGEDGRVQSRLERLGVGYTGSGPTASQLAMSKSAAKAVFRAAGVPTPDYVLLDPRQAAERMAGRVQRLGFPLVVKPDGQGSSLGVEVVRSAGELPGQVAQAARFGPIVLAERLIEGREFTVSVLWGEPLPVLEILGREEIFDYRSKYSSELIEYHFQTEIGRASCRERV